MSRGKFSNKLQTCSIESAHLHLKALWTDLCSAVSFICLILKEKRRLKSSGRGYILILLTALIPIMIWGTDYILKQSQLFERETYKTAAASNVAQAVAESVYPGRPWEKQKDYVYSTGAQCYNDACSSNLKFLSPIASTSKGINSKNITKNLTSAAEFYKTASSYGIGNDIASSLELFPDVSSVSDVSWTKKTDAETNVKAVGFNRIGSRNTYSVTYIKNTNEPGSSKKRSSYTEDSGKFSLSMNTDSAEITCKFPKLKRKATIKLPECQADIVIAIPTNYAACTAGNGLNEALVLPSDSKSSSTPIVQISRAMQDFLEKFDQTCGVGVGIIPYSGKLSLPPNRSDWTISLPMATQSPTDEYITQNMFYSSDGRYGGKLKTNTNGTSSFGIYSNWGNDSYGLPIMTRYGTTETRRGMTLYTGLDGNNLLSAAAPTSDKYKFIRMNLNPCYLGFCNTLAMTCERECPTYLANPYFIKELTADVPEVIGDLGLYAPIDEAHNKSNFLFLPIIWARNLFSSWTSHPSSTKTSLCPEKSRTSKTKYVVIVANAPDNFEPNEMTYLGFNNDFSEIPMYESDSILFAKNGYILENGIYKGTKNAVRYQPISGATSISSSKGLVYSGNGTAKIICPTKGIIKITATGSVKPDITFPSTDPHAFETQMDNDDFGSKLSGSNATNFYIFPTQMTEQDSEGNYYVDININSGTEIFLVEVNNRPYRFIPAKIEMLGSDNSTPISERTVVGQENVVFRTNMKEAFLFDAIAPYFWYSGRTDWRDNEGTAEIRCNTDKFSFTATGTVPAKGRGITSVSQNSVSYDRKLSWVSLPTYVKPYFDLKLSNGSKRVNDNNATTATWNGSHTWNSSELNSNYQFSADLGFSDYLYHVWQYTDVGTINHGYNSFIGYTQDATLSGTLRACNLTVSRTNARFRCGYDSGGIRLYHDTKMHIWAWNYHGHNSGCLDGLKGCITFRQENCCIGFDFYNDPVGNFGPGRYSVIIERWHNGKYAPDGNIKIGGVNIHNFDDNDYTSGGTTHSRVLYNNSSTIEVSETGTNKGYNGIHGIEYICTGEYTPSGLSCSTDGSTSYSRSIPYGADAIIRVTPRKKEANNYYVSSPTNSGSFGSYSSTISPASDILINTAATFTENSHYAFKYTSGKLGSTTISYSNSGQHSISNYSATTSYFYNNFYAKHVMLGGILSDNGKGQAGSTSISSNSTLNTTAVLISPDNYNFVKQSDDTYLVTVPCKHIHISNIRFRDFENGALSNIINTSPKVEILSSNNSTVVEGRAVGETEENVVFRTNVKAPFRFSAIAPYFWYGTTTDWKDKEGTAQLRANTNKFSFRIKGTVPAKGQGITSVSQNSISHDRKLSWVSLPAYIKPYFDLKLNNGLKRVDDNLNTTTATWNGSRTWNLSELNSNYQFSVNLDCYNYLYHAWQYTDVGNMSSGYNSYIGYTQDATLSGTLRACNLTVSRNNARFKCEYDSGGIRLRHDTKVHIWTWNYKGNDSGCFDGKKGCITFRQLYPCIGFDFYNDPVVNFGPGTYSVSIERWHDGDHAPAGNIKIGGVNIHNFDDNDYTSGGTVHSRTVSSNSTIELSETDTDGGYNGIYWIKYESSGEYTPSGLSCSTDGSTSYSRSIPYGADAIIRVTPRKVNQTYSLNSPGNSGSFGSYSSTISPASDILINTAATFTENSHYAFKYTSGKVATTNNIVYGTSGYYNLSNYASASSYFYQNFSVQHVTLGGIPSSNGKGKAGNINVFSSSNFSTTAINISPADYDFVQQADGTYLVTVPCKNVYVTGAQFKVLGIVFYEHPHILKNKPTLDEGEETTENFNTEPLANTRIVDGFYSNSGPKTYGDIGFSASNFIFQKVQRLYYGLLSNSNEIQFKCANNNSDFFIQLWDQGFDMQKILWKYGSTGQSMDYLDPEFGKFRSNYEFTGLHRVFIPYEVYGKDLVAFSGALNSALVFAGFTIPLNYFLYKNGYQTVTKTDGLATACTSSNDAISNLAVAACAKLKADGAVVYLVKYRMGKAKTSIDDKVDSVGEADNETDLRSLFFEIAKDIKERAGATKSEINLVEE